MNKDEKSSMDESPRLVCKNSAHSEELMVKLLNSEDYVCSGCLGDMLEDPLEEEWEAMDTTARLDQIEAELKAQVRRLDSNIATVTGAQNAMLEDLHSRLDAIESWLKED